MRGAWFYLNIVGQTSEANRNAVRRVHFQMNIRKPVSRLLVLNNHRRQSTILIVH